MCSGKSTLGKELSKQLETEFIDLDEYIETTQGRSISDIFAAEGENEFRVIEAKALDNIINSYGQTTAVIALGGGTPCRPGVMESLNKAGTTVHLEVPVPRIVERLLLEPAKRPLIHNKSADELMAYVEQMLSLRNPYYSKSTLNFNSSRLETKEEIESSARQLIEFLV